MTYAQCDTYHTGIVKTETNKNRHGLSPTAKYSWSDWLAPPFSQLLTTIMKSVSILYTDMCMQGILRR